MKRDINISNVAKDQIIRHLKVKLISVVIGVFGTIPKCLVAQSAGAVEYTDCFPAERLDPHNECPGYDTKQSDGEDPAGALGNAEYPFIAIAPRSILARSGST